MIKLKELIKENCECGNSCCSTKKQNEIIKESLQLPNGKQIQMGRIFTGQGKAFVKEEDLNEEITPLSKSDIKKMERTSQKLIKDLETFLKVWKKKHKVSVSDSVLYDTSKEWEGVIRDLKIKFGGWFGFVYDSDYVK